MQLPSDLQRLLPYVAVAVLAVAGLLLVVRGVPVSSDGDSATPSPATERPQPAPEGRSGGSERGGADPGSGSSSEGGTRSGSGQGERSSARRSSEAYVACVGQAADTAALERCQALLPRR